MAVVVGAEVGDAVGKSAKASTSECAAEGFSQIFSESDRGCGVSGVLNMDDGVYHEPDDMHVVPHCSRMMTTNCSLSYAPVRCPSECPYLAPNAAFSCIFECVTGDMCAEANPEKAFPNPKSHVCSTCSIIGCKHCSAPDRCEKCWPDFELSDDKSACSFGLDKKSHSREIVMVLAVVVGGILLMALVWPLIFGTHPEASSNFVAIQRARRHRHLAKVQSCNLNARDDDGRKLYSCFANVHKLNILGVGLPLFYNQICFLMLVSLICWGVTWSTYKMNNVHYALSNFEGNDLLSSATAGAVFTASSEMMVSPIEQAPAMIYSPLALCPKESSHGIKSVLRDYAKTNFYTVGALYMILFVLSLWFGNYQKREAYKFDEQHATQSDYALHVRGLPTKATDEGTLREWLETEFRKVVPGYQKRPPEKIFKGANENDEVKRRSDTKVEVHAVSICYNFGDKNDQVEDVKWNLIERMEVEMHQKAKDDSWQLDSNNTMAASKNFTMDQVDDDQRSKVQAWFDGKDSLESTGELFVVFKWLSDKDLVMKYFNENPTFLKHPDAPTTPVTLHTVFFGASSHHVVACRGPTIATYPKDSEAGLLYIVGYIGGSASCSFSVHDSHRMAVCASRQLCRGDIVLHRRDSFGKLEWLPVYDQLSDRFPLGLPPQGSNGCLRPFHEHCPSVLHDHPEHRYHGVHEDATSRHRCGYCGVPRDQDLEGYRGRECVGEEHIPNADARHVRRWFAHVRAHGRRRPMDLEWFPDEGHLYLEVFANLYPEGLKGLLALGAGKFDTLPLPERREGL